MTATDAGGWPWRFPCGSVWRSFALFFPVWRFRPRHRLSNQGTRLPFPSPRLLPSPVPRMVTKPGPCTIADTNPAPQIANAEAAGTLPGSGLSHDPGPLASISRLFWSAGAAGKTWLALRDRSRCRFFSRDQPTAPDWRRAGPGLSHLNFRALRETTPETNTVACRDFPRRAMVAQWAARRSERIADFPSHPIGGDVRSAPFHMMTCIASTCEGDRRTTRLPSFTMHLLALVMVSDNDASGHLWHWCITGNPKTCTNQVASCQQRSEPCPPCG